MKIEDRRGESLTEATVTVDDQELMDLLQGLADVVEGTREHLHFNQLGGPQLVVRRALQTDDDPLRRQLDWWLGPLVLVGVLLLIIGLATLVRWIGTLI
ncbi:MAG: hypothetical protein LC808_41650 [Actinobacteria bacterium]|nr:hypothetical protein [Actinomycetota bacterium]